MADEDVSTGDIIVEQAKRRVNQCVEGESRMRVQIEDDVRFAFADRQSDQWDEDTLNKRGDRPCYTYNRVGQAIDQVVNDQRQARPQIKVRGVEDSDAELADVYNGLIRNIEAMSDAESVYDDAFQYNVSGGAGYWRVLPEYSDDQTFNQDLYVRPVESQFSVYMDPMAQHVTKCDSEWCVLSVWMDEDAYQEEYPDADLSEFEARATRESGFTEWYANKQIRIAEYYRKVEKLETLYEFNDGTTARSDDVDLILEEITEERDGIRRKRDVKVLEVEWYKLNGVEVLDGPITYRTRWIPVIRDCGKRIRLSDGEHVKGITRDARDAQKSYNYVRSDVIEDTLMKPKAPFFLSAKTLANVSFRNLYKNAHKVLTNFLPYEPDPSDRNGGAPIPNTTSGMDVGKLTVLQQDIDDIKATSGHYDASLGGEGPETSGVMVGRRQNQSGIAAYVYHDNHGKAIAQTGRVLVELIPIIYSNERVVRILNTDLTEEFVQINSAEQSSEPGKPKAVGNITKAKFDVSVDTGPSYATQREEATDKILAIGRDHPVYHQLGADIIAKGLDIPNADELVKRIRRKMIAEGVIEPNLDDPDEAKLAEAMQQGNGQNEAMNYLIAAQAKEAEAQAAESVADIAEKEAKAFKVTQDAIAQYLENQIMERKLRIDPDGFIEVIKKSMTTGP